MSDHATSVQLSVSALFEVSNIGVTALVWSCKSEAIGAGMARVKDFSQPLPWSGQMAVLRLPRNAPKTHASCSIKSCHQVVHQRGQHGGEEVAASMWSTITDCSPAER